MADHTETSPALVFRSNKRRKIFKKRGPQDERNADEPSEDRPEPKAMNEGLTTGRADSDQLPPVVRRPASKKHGIHFSSSGATTDQTLAETALVPVKEKQDCGVLSTDRFTKPTGKAGVVEDKHLAAYVDSKLAELRSLSAIPQLSAESSVAAGSSVTEDHASSLGDVDVSQSSATRATEPRGAQALSQGQREGYPHGSPNRKARPRRQRHARDASDVARDAMVDAIMKESQVPLYDQSASAPRPGMESDEAAAHTFKAQFLLDLQQKKRKKPPPPGGAEKTSSGPKLGGSKSQRQKMRALEEAKNAAPKK